MRIRLASPKQQAAAAEMAVELKLGNTFRDLVAEAPKLWVATFRTGYPIAAAAGLSVQGKRADLTISFVHPDFRGLNLQQRLIRVRLDYARKHGAREAYTYCYRANSASLVSLLKEGFVVSGFDGNFVYVRRWLVAQ